MTSKIKKVLLVVCLLIAVFTVAHFALAADFWAGDTDGAGFANNAGLPGAVTDLRVIIANIIRIALGFLGIIAVILIIYAGFLWMTAGGNEQQIEKAKKVLIGALIGLVLIIFSFAIASFILNSLISVTGGDGDGSVCAPACASSDQHCCASVCISSATPCNPLPPVGGETFRITSTIPRDQQLNLVRNVVIKAYLNKAIADSVDQMALDDNFKVEKISDIDPGTGNLINQLTVPVEIPNGHPVRAFADDSRRLITYTNATACGNEQNTPNCFPAWTQFKVTINGFSGIISINNQSLSCGSGSNCQFVFSTDDTIDTSGPRAGIVPEQICKDDGTLGQIANANLVDGWARDDIGVADIRFCSETEGTENCFYTKPGGLGQTYLSDSYKYDTSDYKVGDDYIFRVRASDLAAQVDQAEFTTKIRAGHCCNGKKDGAETDIDCGGDCGACDGGACATDISIPTNNNNCSANNNLCASQFCTSQNSGVTSCQDAGYAAGTPSCCLCRRPPVITGVFPVGGFCSNDNNKPCLINSDCGAGNTCNVNTPNGAVGNFVTIVGRNFGASGALSKVSFNNIDASLASAPGCANSWSDTQIIAVVPAGGNGPVKVTTAANFSDDSTANPKIDNFLVNNISRPGLCSLSPSQGVIDTTVNYSGIKLSDNKAYFGGFQQYISATGPAFTSDTQGSAQVSNITVGRTTSFVMKDNVYSNYLGFTKDAEPYSGPIISSFNPTDEPLGYPIGQYVTINGSGFGNKKGVSEVYFGSVAGDKKADYNFPAVCADSIWGDKQVIVKVPPGIGDGSYVITMKIAKAGGGFWDDINTSNLTPSEFIVKLTQPLRPSLCKINPTIGKINSQVSLYGEYFGTQDAHSKVRFQLNKNQTIFSYWAKDNDPKTTGIKPDKIITTVPDQAVTGSVKVVKDSPEKFGNGLNFKVGVCQNTAECGSGSLCCEAGTPYAGECKAGADAQTVCFPQIKSCVYEWNFSTGGNGVGDPCYNGAASGVCDITKSRCVAPLTCNSTTCTCQPSPSGCFEPNTRCPASGLMQNCCDSDETCDETTGQCFITPDSCSGYGNQCNDSYFCPNSPGKCSSNPGGSVDTGVECGDSACGSSVSPDCASGDYSCQYASSLNRCILFNSDKNRDISCGFPKTVPYALGPTNFIGTASCLPYNNQNRWIMTVTTSCPAGWTNIGGNRCVQDGNLGTCSVCLTGFKCLQETVSATSGAGVCAVDKAICPAGSVCSTAGSTVGKCVKSDSGGCECCCRKDNNDQDCCVGLQCKGACGTKIDPANTEFGVCTGCTVRNNGTGPVNQAASNQACNCTGTSGKYCETSGAGGQGVCLDCAQIRAAGDCTNKGIGVCCVDAEKSNVCRGGTAPYASGATGDTNNYCAYYNCDTGNNANKCKTDLPLKNGSYRTTTCDNKCAFPPQFGQTCNSYTTTLPSCDTSICQNFSCLNENGSGPTPPSTCGTCCCKPPVNPGDIDSCKTLNPILSCRPNQAPCTSTTNKRGLCCGCAKDSDCGSADTTGCGSDTCCHARPAVISTMPADGAGNGSDPRKVCRNILIQATFNQAMQVNTFAGNVIVAADYGVSQCPAGTEYLTAVYKPTILARAKSFLSKLPLVNKLFASDAWALPGNFCTVLGSVSGYVRAGASGANTTVMEFKIQKALEPNQKYYVIIKGDTDLTGAINSGVLSADGIGMNGDGPIAVPTTFNGVAFVNAKIWSFTTKPIIVSGGTVTDSGICQVDSITINPDSWLFNTIENNPADDITARADYDTISDRDKVFRATAYSADGQPVTRLLNVYDWRWDWAIDNTAVVKFNGSGDQAVNSAGPLPAQTLVAQNIKDAKTLLHAKTTITKDTVAGTTGATKQVAAPIYVFLCANPWPIYKVEYGNLIWKPWYDNLTNCGNYAGTGTCYDTGFELYYCRDAGGAGTADDLPAISDEAVIRGSSNEILKEFYFFREGLPDMTDKTLATTTNFEIRQGSKAGLIWPVVSGATGYKIYYGTASGNYTNSVATSTNGTTANPQIISGLTNGRKYYFAFTSYNDKKAESGYSNETTAIPDDTTKPAKPSILWVVPTADSTATIAWKANSDDTVSYKVYYGASPDYLGGTVSVNKDKCSGYACVATVTNLNPGATYYFAVAALDVKPNESNKSAPPKSLTMVSTSRAGDLVKLATAFYLYAGEHGGQFPANTAPDGRAACLGFPSDQLCWKKYLTNSLIRGGDPPNFYGLWGSTALNNSLAPYLSKIPLDPKKDDPARIAAGVGDAYMYFKGGVTFGCCQNPSCPSIPNAAWIIFQPDQFIPEEDRGKAQIQCSKLGFTAGTKSYVCCSGLSCGSHYYCAFKLD